MRWMWIDRIVELRPRERMVAVKAISLAEEHLHDHFAADEALGLPATPVMPASLIIEGMAQTAGILVGHAEEFREKVILAKIGRAQIDEDALPGDTLRYTATIAQMDAAGAATEGIVEILRPVAGAIPGGADAGEAVPGGTVPGGFAPPRQIGRIDLVFSHIDRNMAGAAFPEHNFVFGEAFRTLLRMSGVK